MGIGIRDVTVIVPTRSRKEQVGTLLSSLKHPHDLVCLVVNEGREGEDLPATLNGQVVLKCPKDAGPVAAAEHGILESKTSHFILLGDDVKPEPDLIGEAVKCYNETFGDKDAVVRLNATSEAGDEGLACFPLMSRKFYMDLCYPVPYRRFYQDTEWTAKAKLVGRYAVAEKARLYHPWEPHHREELESELPIFQERMAQFTKAMAAPVKAGTKVFIAVPIFNDVDVHFFDSMMKFIKSSDDLDCKVAVVAGDSLVPRARNVLTMEFLKSDCTHLMFIDSDLVFSAEQVSRLLSHDVDIVGGFYPKKQQGRPEMVFNTLNPPAPMDERRLTPVKYIGTGFMCAKRKVFEKIIEEMGDDLIFQVDGKPGKFNFDFWSVGVYAYKDGTRRYLSEDWYFCQRAIDLGFTVYGDNGVVLKHSGRAVYPLQTQEPQIFGRLPTSDAAKSAALPASPPCKAAATLP